MIVAVMSLPLRARYCADFVRRAVRDGPVTVIVPDGRVFDTDQLPDEVRVVATSSSPQAAPTERLLRHPVSRRAVGWMRGGSRSGVRVERSIRALAWRLRHVDRVAFVVREHRPHSVRNEPLLHALEELARDTVISELVAFDAFDLPTLIEFAADRDQRVMLR